MVESQQNTWSITNHIKQLLFACLLIITGLGLLLGSPYIFTTFLKGELNLVENGYLDKLWRIYPMPVYLELYVFNWTNPEDIYKPEVKPRFKEIGPFVFKDLKEKVNVSWNANDTVTFQQYHTFWFDREKSVADLNIEITTINIVLVSAVHMANQNQLGYFMRRSMQMAFDMFKTNLILKKTFKELFFEGYYEPLLHWTQSMRFLYTSKLPYTDKFSFFQGKNESSYEGTFNMGTSYHNFGVLKQWNYSNTTRFYKGTCSHATGISAGELHLPNVKNNISIFFPEMCKYLTLYYDDDQEIESMLGKKYSLDVRTLDNGTIYPENKCHCPADCFPSGVQNISMCQYGAPIFMSLPHFYLADKYYLDRVEGFKPEKDLHECYFTINPVTGIPLRATMRGQVNLLVRPIKHFRDFKEIPTLMFPVFWLQQTIQVPSNFLFTQKLILYIPLMTKISGSILLLLGLYFFYPSFHFSCKPFFTWKKKQPHLHTVTTQELASLNAKEKINFMGLHGRDCRSSC